MVAEPITFPKVAVMLEVPPLSAVADPLALMVAIAAADELQVTDDETSLLLPSLYLPVAKNDVLVPASITGPEGATVIEIKLACGGGGVVPPLDALPPPQPTNTAEASNTGAKTSTEIRVNRIANTPRKSLSEPGICTSTRQRRGEGTL